MSFVKSALIAASLVLGIAAANAQGREDLATGFHGNTPPRISSFSISQDARGAFAEARAMRGPVTSINPVSGMFQRTVR